MKLGGPGCSCCAEARKRDRKAADARLQEIIDKAVRASLKPAKPRIKLKVID